MNNAPTYLIKLGLGSVQRFIGAARRSRDLWCGSWLVAEVVKAAARHLHARGDSVALIFPAPVNPSDDLAPGSDFQPSNVVLAQVQTDDPADLVDGALSAAHERWRELTDLALANLRERLRRSIVDVDEDVWRAQAEDALAPFGVWLLWSDPTTNPPLAELEALYSARKRTRTFRAHPVEVRRDKSSLDARGESVLDIPAAEGISPRLRYRLGLNHTEQLDAPGWTKRLGIRLVGGRRFTPLIRVALDPWLRAVAANAALSPDLDGLREDCRKLARLGLATRVDAECYARFPYDGELMLPTRWRAARAELSQVEPTTGMKPGMRQLQKFEDHHARLTDKIKQRHPTHKLGEPYLAIVCADGDRLGKIQERCTSQQLRDLSRFLSGFALAAREIVARHQGDCIYAGGDELLALVPLDRLWLCLQELRAEFVAGIAGLELPPGADSDYSIGAAIVHASERDALALTREALTLAKNVEADDPDNRRKALGIVYRPRSGATVRARSRWRPAGDPQPTASLRAWQNAFRDKTLPRRTPYMLRRLLATHSWALADNRKAKDVLSREIRRALARRRPSEPSMDTGVAPLEQLADEIGALVASTPARSDLTVELEHWVNALLIVRSVAEHCPWPAVDSTP